MSVTSLTISPPVGATQIVAPALFYSRILAVVRNGFVYTRVSYPGLTDGQMQWALFLNRVRFPASMPFLPDEKIFILYKLFS